MLKVAQGKYCPHRELFFFVLFCVYTNPTIWTLFPKVFQNLEMLMLLYTPQYVLAFDKIKGFL